MSTQNLPIYLFPIVLNIGNISYVFRLHEYWYVPVNPLKGLLHAKHKMRVVIVPN